MPIASACRDTGTWARRPTRAISSRGAWRTNELAGAAFGTEMTSAARVMTEACEGAIADA